MSQLLIQKSPPNGCFLACRAGSAQGEHLRAQGVPDTTPMSQEPLLALPAGRIPTDQRDRDRPSGGSSAPILGLWGQGQLPGAGKAPWMGCGTNITTPPSSAKRVFPPNSCSYWDSSGGSGFVPCLLTQFLRFGPFCTSPSPFPLRNSQAISNTNPLAGKRLAQLTLTH